MSVQLHFFDDSNFAVKDCQMGTNEIEETLVDPRIFLPMTATSVRRSMRFSRTSAFAACHSRTTPVRHRAVFARRTHIVGADDQTREKAWG